MLTCKAQENTRDIINRVVERGNRSKPKRLHDKRFKRKIIKEAND